MSDQIDAKWKNVPVCPYCGTENHDWWDKTILRNDGDTDYCKCGSCGEEYHVTLRVSSKFATEKILQRGKESHSE